MENSSIIKNIFLQIGISTFFKELYILLREVVMKIVRLMIMLIVSMALIGALLGCGAGTSQAAEEEGQAAQKDKLTEVLERGKLVAVMDASYPPLDYMDPKSGEIVGMVVDMVKLYGEWLGVEVEIVNSDWSGMFPGLFTDKYDIITTHLTRNVPRTVTMALSDPYFFTGTTAILRTDSKIKKYEDINSPDVKVGVSKGSFYVEMVEKEFPKAELLRFDQKLDWTEALKTGRIDVVIEAEVAAADMFKIYPDTFKLIPDGYYASETFGFAVKQGEFAFKNSIDLFLQEIKFSGKYAELYLQWMGREWDPNYDGGAS